MRRMSPRTGSSQPNTSPRRASRGKRLLRGACVLLAVFVVVDVGFSLFLIRDGLLFGYPLPPFGALTHPKQLAWLDGLGREETDGIGRFDPELGWSWRPSSSAEDGRFHTNSIGARGQREYAPTPAEGSLRVLFFGDSFTFGDEIPDNATFEAIIEGRRPQVEAINFGVSAYGTDQAWLRYRRVGRELQADVVCIGLMLENIGRNVNRYRPLWNTRTGFCGAKPRFYLDAVGDLQLAVQPFPTRESLLEALLGNRLIEEIAEHEYWLGKPQVWTGRYCSLGRILGGILAEYERSPPKLWRDHTGEPFRVTMAVLEGFHMEALADGARAAPVLIFPTRGALFDYALEGRSYWRELLDELERRGIPYIDLIPPLVQRQIELDEQEGPMSLYYGGHLTSVGNSVVADEINAFLDKFVSH